MRVAIVGLRALGISIGLALRQAGWASSIAGHDANRQRSARAKRLEAVDRIEWDVIRACRDADLVVIDLPPAGVRQALDLLAGELRQDALVVALGQVLAPLMADAQQLSGRVAFVGGHLVSPTLLSDDEEPAASHVQGSCFFLVPAESVDTAALDRIGSLAEALEAQPIFTTAVEHDGLAAVGVQLPIALAWAMHRVASTEAGWQDRQRMLGSAYAAATATLPKDRDGVAEMMVANAEPLAVWLDELMQALAELGGRLAAGDAAEVDALLEAAANDRASWLARSAEKERAERPPLWRKLWLGREKGQRA